MASRKFKILFVIGSLTGGGAERQIITILRHLDRTRFEPHLYLINRRGELLNQVPEDVPVYSFEDLNVRNLFYYPGRVHFQQVHHLKQVLAEQQIDLVYDRTYHATLITAPATRKTRIARISVIVSEPDHALASHREKFRALKQRQLRKAYSLADAVVTVSKSLAECVTSHYQLPAQKVIPIYNGYDFTEISELAQKYQPDFSPEQFHIVSVGRLSPEKNFGMLINAVKLLFDRNYRQIQLHLLGQGPQEQELRALSRSCNIEKHVHYTGYLQNPFPWYRHAQLSCLCSNFEGLPNTLIEAMACGTPVIATDCPYGPAEILGAGKFGRLIPVNDVQALASAIAQAIEHYPEWQSVAQLAKTHVEATYSVKKGIQHLQKLMLSILS